MKKPYLLFVLHLFCTGGLLAQTDYVELDYNNTRVSVSSGGDFFRSPKTGGFEVPKQVGNENRTSTIFTSGLWLGGLDVDSNIHLAVMTYRQRGQDFWAGPIGSKGSHNNTYNRVFKISKEEIDVHIAHPNKPIKNILGWPGNGDTASGEPHQLAPFVDVNRNGLYEPLKGDYPKIKGIGAAYCMYNDADTHTQTGALPFGVEVHQLFYQDTFTLEGIYLDDINLATFTIINRSDNTYSNFKMGIFTDYDLGNFNDDYVGCDPSIDLGFVYNGDDNDEGADGYGTTPPAQGLAFLNQRMGTFVAYQNNASPINGNPIAASDYYNYLNSKWRTGTDITFGGKGILHSNTKASFMYPFQKDPEHPNQNWNESTANNTPGDRRAIATTTPIALVPGESVCYDVAFIHARATSGTAEESIKTLKAKTRIIRLAYHNNLRGWKGNCQLGAQQIEQTVAVPSIKAKDASFYVYPNPGNAVFAIQNLQTDKPVMILNALGETIDVLAPNKSTFNLADFPSGVYFLKTDKGTARFVRM